MSECADEDLEHRYYGHGRGLVITQPESGVFKERPMTTAELVAREPARQIQKDIFRHANYAGVCYYELWDLIAAAAQQAVDVETKELRVRWANILLEHTINLCEQDPMVLEMLRPLLERISALMSKPSDSTPNPGTEQVNK